MAKTTASVRQARPAGRRHTKACREPLKFVGGTPILRPQRYKFTPEAFHRLGELGFFDPDQRVELMEGDIYEMAPIEPEHSSAIERSSRLFYRYERPEEFHVRVQNPLQLGESEPIPDIAVVPGKIEDYRDRHPTTALLVIEIADTSLQHDRTRKLALYAKAGIPEYWIINLMERVLEVYREPSGRRYKSVRYHTPDETISPLFAPDWQIEVESLFG